MLTFNKKYLYLTLILFFIEVFIALFINDSFIRPFIGDVLVIILIYCFIKTFWNINSSIAVLFVFVFACIIEILQYFNLVNHLGLQQSKIATVILGNTFDWKDIIAYLVGSIAILLLEKIIKKIRTISP
ncbi:MAG: DUF2809 domain-containing protein [Cyanobacteria bacterium P01_D01_bin.50]